jgi:hypothetical protein
MTRVPTRQLEWPVRSVCRTLLLSLLAWPFGDPLTDEQVEQLRELPFAGAPSPEMAVRRAIVWILCSPEFLYADLTPPINRPHRMRSPIGWRLPCGIRFQMPS